MFEDVIAQPYSQRLFNFYDIITSEVNNIPGSSSILIFCLYEPSDKTLVVNTGRENDIIARYYNFIETCATFHRI
jgi:hypothetical protein